MAEFGEQLKKAREANGLTQQSFAEKIYVTRQTVSRWESGARYPDLHTAKKISEVLGVSIDELLSGEEIQTNIEKIPVLDKTSEIVIQTVAYSIALCAYLLMSYFSWKEVLFINEALKGTPAGKVGVINIITLIKYTVITCVLVYGIVNSSKRALTPKKITLVVSMPYIFVILESIVSYINMRLKNNGNLSLADLGLEVIIPSICVATIYIFFCKKTNKISWIITEMVCIVSLMYVTYIYCMHLKVATNLGFAASSIHVLGMIGMIILLGYQAFIFQKRKLLAIKK